MTREHPDVVAVGLTGGIGAGKSTALRFFAEAGALTLSADEVVHEIYGREGIRRAVAEHFGIDVLSIGGEVDRRRLAGKVKGDREALAWVESLLHPLVAEDVRRFIGQAPPGVVVCEVPLLFEAGMEGLFDLVVTVEAEPEVRRQRSVQAFDLELFEEFDGLQVSSERRVAGADLAYFNDGRVEHLRAFVQAAYERASKVARRSGSDGATG